MLLRVVKSLLNMVAGAGTRSSGGLHRTCTPAQRNAWLFVVGAFLLGAGGLAPAWAAEGPAMVDAERMKNADKDAANWPSYGRTYSEQRFSPLTEINADNAKQLGLAWFADLDTNR